MDYKQAILGDVATQAALEQLASAQAWKAHYTDLVADLQGALKPTSAWVGACHVLHGRRGLATTVGAVELGLKLGSVPKYVFDKLSPNESAALIVSKETVKRSWDAGAVREHLRSLGDVDAVVEEIARLGLGVKLATKIKPIVGQVKATILPISKVG